MRRTFRLRPIGYIRTRYTLPEETPTQAPLNADERGQLVIYPRYAPALEGLADFEYAQLVTLLDRVPEGLPEGVGQLVQVPFMLQQLDIPGWPDRNVHSIRGGWYQRVDVVNAGGLLAGRQSLERSGMLRPQFQEDVS